MQNLPAELTAAAKLNRANDHQSSRATNLIRLLSVERAKRQGARQEEFLGCSSVLVEILLQATRRISYPLRETTVARERQYLLRSGDNPL